MKLLVKIALVVGGLVVAVGSAHAGERYATNSRGASVTTSTTVKDGVRTREIERKGSRGVASSAKKSCDTGSGSCSRIYTVTGANGAVVSGNATTIRSVEGVSRTGEVTGPYGRNWSRKVKRR